MKRKLLSVLPFLGILLTSASSIAQTADTQDTIKVEIKDSNLPTLKSFRTWDIGGAIGLTAPNMDISSTSFTRDCSWALSLNATKFFSYSFALRAELLTGKLVGNGSKEGSNAKYSFDSRINYEFAVMGMFQLGNFAYVNRDPRLAFYGYLGAGIVNTDPNVYRTGVDPNPSKNYYIGTVGLDSVKTDDTKDYHNLNQFILPVGVGFKFHYSENISFTTDFSVRFSTSDKMDGFYTHLSATDAYSYLNVGVAYHLGKGRNVLQWSKPSQNLVAQVTTTRKAKVDEGSMDTDGDGVSDRFDKEPNTPAGVKVYGDGTTVPVVQASQEAKEDVSTMINNGAWLPSIFFEVNSIKINPKYDESLTSIVVVLNDHPELKLEIIGSADTRASQDYNKSLGQTRADAVKERLVKFYGVDSARLTTKSVGADNNIAKDINLNRRVDFRIIK